MRRGITINFIPYFLISDLKSILWYKKKQQHIFDIVESANSFAALCNWIRELSNSIKELSNTANTPALWKSVGIRELSNSITEL